MQGRIIKGIAGFYYVYTVESGVWQCKARGLFRKDGKKPLVGDEVTIDVTDPADREARILEILPRKNELIRPAVANVDQAMILFALASPDPDLLLLDRFLITMERQHVPVLICFNKLDLDNGNSAEHYRELYEACGYEVLLLCARKGEGVDLLRERIKGSFTVAAGPSGVGKSSLTNLLSGTEAMETGEISRKLRRGKNTTRHSEMILLDDGTVICDTPGFTSLSVPDMKKEELRFYYPELAPYEGHCRFNGCVHINEPGCAVKDALQRGALQKERYESYQTLYGELEEQEKRRY
jgi:ribosome biogenesis GTPase